MVFVGDFIGHIGKKKLGEVIKGSSPSLLQELGERAAGKFCHCCGKALQTNMSWSNTSTDYFSASDTFSILQQPELQMDERDEAAAPAEQVNL